MGQANCTTCVKTINREEYRSDGSSSAKERREDRINEMAILRGIIRIQAVIRG